MSDSEIMSDRIISYFWRFFYLVAVACCVFFMMDSGLVGLLFFGFLAWNFWGKYYRLIPAQRAKRQIQ